MVDLLKAAFDVLSRWPLVEGAVAILVLIFAALLARGALKERLPPAAAAAAAPQSAPVAVEHWLAQQVIETHFEVEQIKAQLPILTGKLDTVVAQLSLLAALNNKIDGLTSLLKRRQSRKSKN